MCRNRHRRAVKDPFTLATIRQLVGECGVTLCEFSLAKVQRLYPSNCPIYLTNGEFAFFEHQFADVDKYEICEDNGSPSKVEVSISHGGSSRNRDGSPTVKMTLRKPRKVKATIVDSVGKTFFRRSATYSFHI